MLTPTHTFQTLWPLTLPPENEAAVSPLPGHLFKAHQSGVDPQALAALPNPVGVTGANTGHEGHWGQTEKPLSHALTVTSNVLINLYKIQHQCFYSVSALLHKI